MARIPQQNQVRPPAGPGALSNRQDLTGNQPLRIPTGLPYGQASQLHAQEAASPMPQGQGSSAAPGQGPPSGPAGAPQPEDPRTVLQAVSGHPTDFPNSPLAPPQPDQAAGAVVNALRQLAVQPFATPQVYQLLQRAQDELQNAGRNKISQAMSQGQPPPQPGVQGGP